MSDVSGQAIMSGPIFAGSYASEMREAQLEIDQELGDRGAELVQEATDRYFKNPTGFYRSQITATPRGEVVHVTDNGVVYGPWLAGVGSRNAISVFKGYPHWQEAFQQLEAETGPRSNDIMMRYLS